MSGPSLGKLVELENLLDAKKRSRAPGRDGTGHALSCAAENSLPWMLELARGYLRLRDKHEQLLAMLPKIETMQGDDIGMRAAAIIRATLGKP